MERCELLLFWGDVPLWLVPRSFFVRLLAPEREDSRGVALSALLQTEHCFRLHSLVFLLLLESTSLLTMKKNEARSVPFFFFFSTPTANPTPPLFYLWPRRRRASSQTLKTTTIAQLPAPVTIATRASASSPSPAGGDDSLSSSSSPESGTNGADDLTISLFKRKRHRRADWSLGPALDLSPDQVLEMQMEALRVNDSPYRDHGVEVLYRFADIDPFARSLYSGRSQDLGQFERFRRLFHAPGYAPLLGHGGFEVVGSLNWEEPARALRRVKVIPGPLVSAPAASAAAAAAAAEKDESKGGGNDSSSSSSSSPPIVEPAHFDWLLAQRVGGRADGVWFTASLTRSEIAQRGGEEEE